jgi:tRNA(adenine34) deaminase
MPALMSAAPPQPGEAAALAANDGMYLRQAIAWSCRARARGNPPFGAVVIGAQGELLSEAYCNTAETGDRTGHAETNAVRQISARVDRDTLAGATLYTSAEPCVMCAGAIFWSGIGRVVFGIDAARLHALQVPRSRQADAAAAAAALSGRDVLAASPRFIECIGPALVAEASAPHVGFWSS